MSKIEVDAIDKQSGSTVTIGGSGTNVVLGTCGQTVSLGTGATQSGFGRTGTVDWQTGSIKTGTFTAANGEGYFVNTSGGVSTANLPAGSAGAIVSFADYTRTFQTNNLTIVPNGSNKIGGVAANFVASTEGQSITLVFVDATEGWINTAESTGQSGLVPAFVTASGGTPSTVGDFKIHTFTGPGTFTVSCAGNSLGSNSVDYLVVAGGGAGGRGASDSGTSGGGGGAGGFRESSGTASGCYSRSPLGACVSALPVTAQGYSVVIGGGGVAASMGPAGSAPAQAPGSNSTFATITSAGGGGGANRGGPTANQTGAAGGSGGGGSGSNPGGGGNTPPVSPAQGFNGGSGNGCSVGAGGGATAVGGNANPSPQTGGVGGAGATTSINNTPTGYAGGGGGGGSNNGSGGLGGPASNGGGRGSDEDNSPTGAAAGTTNTGGGGGGGGGSDPGTVGKNGGSGIVIIRYKFQ